MLSALTVLKCVSKCLVYCFLQLVEKEEKWENAISENRQFASDSEN